MADNEVKKIDETKGASAAGAAAAAASTAPPPTVGTASDRASGVQPVSSGARTGELDAGKSTVKGGTDYFDGKSIITDADTVVDISTIMKDHKASNLSPDKLAQYLKEKGYDVEVVKMGNRSAVRFPNGDYFVDSDGDGNLGTKDQNFQSALTAVEQKFGVNLSDLKASKSLQVHQGGKGDKAGAYGANGAMGPLGLGALNPTQQADMKSAFALLDTRMADRGYDKTERAEELWKNYQLSPVLKDLEIPDPGLPDPGAVLMPGGVQQGLGLFNAAYAVASLREGTLEL